MKTSTLNACWKALLPQIVENGNVIPSENDEYNRVIITASHFEAIGLADMNIEDARELFLEESLTIEELVNQPTNTINDNIENINYELHPVYPNLDLNSIEKGIDFCKKAELCFLEGDNSMVRSGKFKRGLEKLLLPF